MSLSRLFVDQELSLKQHVTLDSEASNYLIQVLRLSFNDSLVVFNGRNCGEFRAVVTTVNKRSAVITIEEFIAGDKESPLTINLLQGVSRGEKMDFTIQKTVELGVNSITPVFTQYGNVKLAGERLASKIAHWQAVAVSAAQQSGRCLVPKVLPVQQFLDCFGTISTGSLSLVLDPKAKTRIAQLSECPSNVTILVGPEGGLSEQELVQARQHNFIPVGLGPRILRTETAALTAISILQARWGDL